MYTHVLQAQKEILDTELDIIAKQNEGADTSELRKRVAELKREVALLHFSNTKIAWNSKLIRNDHSVGEVFNCLVLLSSGGCSRITGAQCWTWSRDESQRTGPGSRPWWHDECEGKCGRPQTKVTLGCWIFSWRKGRSFAAFYGLSAINFQFRSFLIMIYNFISCDELSFVNSQNNVICRVTEKWWTVLKTTPYQV